MRSPTRTELEATMLGFVILVPMAYYAIRTLLAFVGV